MQQNLFPFDEIMPLTSSQQAELRLLSDYERALCSPLQWHLRVNSALPTEPQGWCGADSEPAALTNGQNACSGFLPLYWHTAKPWGKVPLLCLPRKLCTASLGNMSYSHQCSHTGAQSDVS